MNRRHLFILMDNLGIGGQQMFNLNTAKYMTTLGWSLSTAYPKEGSNEFTWLDRWEALGPCLALRGTGTLSHGRDVLPNVWNVATLLRSFRRTRPDVILTGSNWTRTVGAAVGACAGIPVVNLPGSIWIHRRLYTTLARWSGPLHSCSGYIGYSSVNEREYVELGIEPRRIIRSHHGTSLDRFRPQPALGAKTRKALGLPEDGPVLGFVGRLDPEFGLPEATEVLSRTKGWHLLIVGDGPDRDPIEAVIRDKGLEDRVTLTGFVDDPVPYIAVMDCALVYALIDHGGRFNLGTFCVEAMAMGVPVLHFVPADISGGYEEGVSGHHVDNDPGLLHNRLVDLGEDRQRLASMGIQARRFAEAHFDRDDGLARVAEGFELLASGRWPDGSPRRSRRG